MVSFSTLLRTIGHFFYERRTYTTTENGELTLERDISGWWAVLFGRGFYHSSDIYEDMWWRVLSHDLPIRTMRPKRILVLGLGVGCVVHVLQRLLGGAAHITALEWDRTMIQLSSFYYTNSFRSKRFARRFRLPPSIDELPFVLTQENVTLLHADVREYLARTHATYDFIIEDLFTGATPSQCVTNQEFAQMVKRCVAPGGSILINTFPSWEEVLNVWENEWTLLTPIHYKGTRNRLFHMRPTL